MESIAQKIEKIYESKLAIKNSLLKKGIQVDNDFSNYASAIDSINVGASVFNSQEELNANENKQEGNLAIVYNASNPTTPTVFKVVDKNTDRYYINGKLWNIPELTRLIEECDKNNYQQYFLVIQSYDMTYEPYIALQYRFFSLYNENTWFYAASGSGKGLLIANANLEAVPIYFADYSKQGNAMGTATELLLKAGSSETPSSNSSGMLATNSINVRVGDYFNCVCYTDIDKTSVLYNSTSFSKKEADLQYTQLS